MSLEAIKNSYLAEFDENGSLLYKTMREVEKEWAYKAGFQVHDLGSRTLLVLTDTEKLPDMAMLKASRKKFAAWLNEAKETNNLPEGVGKRVTALPQWIIPESKTKCYVDQKPNNQTIVTHIIVRTQIAYRSAALNRDETLLYLDQKIAKKEYSQKKAQNTRQWTRSINIAKEIQSLEKSKIVTEELFDKYGEQLFARLYSGFATKLLLKTPEGAWTTSIATVGIVKADKQTKVVLENPKTREPSKAQQYTLVHTEGKIAFLTKN